MDDSLVKKKIDKLEKLIGKIGNSDKLIKKANQITMSII